jgi:hypothetical protein
MPWSGPVADSRGWVGGTHYVPKTGLGGFERVIPGQKESNPQTEACLRADSRPADTKASAARRHSAPDIAHASE